MITYNRSAFGINLLFRLHGSAIYRSCVPAFFAVLFFLLIKALSNHSLIELKDVSYNNEIGDNLGHPYAVGVIITGTTFLIVFRANQGYSRYWEACSSVYQMMSKWMDASSHIACYHMQCDHYDPIKPPSFYSGHELNREFFTRDRERVREVPHQPSEELDVPINSQKAIAAKELSKQRATARSINAVTEEIDADSSNGRASKKKLIPKLRKRPIPSDSVRSGSNGDSVRSKYAATRVVTPMSARDLSRDSQHPRPLLGPARLDGNWGPLFDDAKSTFYCRMSPNEPFTSGKGFASTVGGRTPPLFLQELVHLTSLLNAVALATLRNDVDDAESPLDLYEPGKPWPAVDPSADPLFWGGEHFYSKLARSFMYFLGYGHTDEERRKYNASRPLPVLGGVSDGEIRFLQLARGPHAKTRLCWAWLSEFITRESVEGSTGKVGPPIISRTIQFVSDGMTAYNHALKVMFIPFPFVHAQLSAAFILVMIPAIPYLMDQYTEDLWLGALLSFFAVLCLTGIHEVARDLENPFRNVPNELPVVTLQAQFNEALLTMYAGYHPDLFWDSQELESFRTNSMASNPSGGNGHAPDSRIEDASRRQSREEFPISDSPGRHQDAGSHLEPISEGRQRSQASSISEMETEMGGSKGLDYIEVEERVVDIQDSMTSAKISSVPPQSTPPLLVKSPENSGVGDTNGDGRPPQQLDGTDPESGSAIEAVVPFEDKSQQQSTAPNQNRDDVDRLKLIVEQQSKLMERMLEEQSRMNKLMEILLQSKMGT